MSERLDITSTAGFLQHLYQTCRLHDQGSGMLVAPVCSTFVFMSLRLKECNIILFVLFLATHEYIREVPSKTKVEQKRLSLFGLIPLQFSDCIVAHPFNLYINFYGYTDIHVYIYTYLITYLHMYTHTYIYMCIFILYNI